MDLDRCRDLKTPTLLKEHKTDSAEISQEIQHAYIQIECTLQDGSCCIDIKLGPALCSRCVKLHTCPINRFFKCVLNGRIGHHCQFWCFLPTYDTYPLTWLIHNQPKLDIYAREYILGGAFCLNSYLHQLCRGTSCLNLSLGLHSRGRFNLKLFWGFLGWRKKQEKSLIKPSNKMSIAWKNSLLWIAQMAIARE
jgi:hypothetical protein